MRTIALVVALLILTAMPAVAHTTSTALAVIGVAAVTVTYRLTPVVPSPYLKRRPPLAGRRKRRYGGGGPGRPFQPGANSHDGAVFPSAAAPTSSPAPASP